VFEKNFKKKKKGTRRIKGEKNGKKKMCISGPLYQRGRGGGEWLKGI